MWSFELLPCKNLKYERIFVKFHVKLLEVVFVAKCVFSLDIGKGKCKGKVHWNADTHLPYIVTGYLRWYCQHSKDRHREKKLCSEVFENLFYSILLQ